MKIANAIYDSVFKYLLEDTRVAKVFLSGILQTEVLEVELRPQEFISDISNLTIYRIDFNAKIRYHNGEESFVLIELQKAKFAEDIMRFRKYLGEYYSNPSNLVHEPKATYGLPLITIYFLGYSLKGLEDIPIIRVARQYLDQSTGKQILKKSDFIESLTHDSIIVQIAAINNKKRKNELEKVLSVFEQGTARKIEIDEDDYPEKYKPIIRRLIRAVADEHLKKEMDVEEEICRELQDKERLATRALEKALKEKKLRKKAEQKEQEAKQKEQEAKQKFINSIKKMQEKGFDTKTIMEITGLSEEDLP